MYFSRGLFALFLLFASCLCAQVEQLQRHSVPNSVFSRLDNMFAQNQIEAAVKELETKLLKQYPRDITLYNYMGTGLLNLGRPLDAVR